MQKWQTKFRSDFQSDEKTTNEIQIRFSKWCEHEKRKLKLISVFQSDAKTKYEVQNRFSKLGENEKQKAKFKSVFRFHAKRKNGNGTLIPFSHAIEKRLALRYTHSQATAGPSDVFYRSEENEYLSTFPSTTSASVRVVFVHLILIPNWKKFQNSQSWVSMFDSST